MFARKIFKYLIGIGVSWGIIFILLSWHGIFVNIALLFPGIAIGSVDRDPSDFNTAIYLAQTGEYRQSLAILERLANTSSPYLQRNEVLELYADVLYLSSGSRDDTKRLYTLSYELSPIDRVQEKIGFLSGIHIEEKGASQSGGSMANMAQNETNFSGAEMIRSTISALKQSEGERQKYLAPINGITTSDKEKLSDIRQFLEEGVERIDW